MRALILGTLLLGGCATSVSSTLESAKVGCRHSGAEVHATIKNVGGEESIRITCQFVVPQQEAF